MANVMRFLRALISLFHFACAENKLRTGPANLFVKKHELAWSVLLLSSPR